MTGSGGPGAEHASHDALGLPGPFRLGIVVGLDAEARLARRLGPAVLIGIGGATSAGAAQAAADLASRGATHLLSFGLAAGLDPSLRAGDLLVPAQVVVDGHRHDADPRLRGLLGGGSDAPLLHSESLVSEPDAKAALRRSSGCGSLDMESGAVALAGRPFAVLRAVCDPAGRALPPAARIALRPDGRLKGLQILGSILRHPGQLPDLLALARDAGRAKQALAARITKIAQSLMIA